MNPYASWAIVLALLGLSTWYYNGRPNILARLSPSDSTPKHDDSRVSTKARKKSKVKKDTGSDDNKADNETSIKESLSQKLKETTNKSKDLQPVEDPKVTPKGQPGKAAKGEPNADDNNKAFADRMSKVREGTSLKPTETSGQSKKERRGQKAALNNNLSASPIISTGPSSSTGGDADDDMSPVASPALDPSKAAGTKSGDVSDMLEEGPGGPSVLRLTGDIESGSRRKAADAPFQAAETKKQRQARLKRERQKEEVAEAEKHRKALMEQQLRSARLAEGTSKQTKASSFSPPPNAWSQAPTPKARDQKAENGGNKPGPLLDTFDTSVQKKSSANDNQYPATKPVGTEKEPDKLVGSSNNSSNNIQTAQNKASSFPANGAEVHITLPPKQDVSPVRKPIQPVNSSDNAASSHEKLSWADDFPSEEDQIRILQDKDEEDVWNTVTSRKDKKKLASKVREVNDYGSVNASSSENLRSNAHKANGINPSKAAATGAKTLNRGNGFASLEIPTSGNGFHDSEWEA